MSIEIISLIASSLTGFLFKMIAQHSADRQEQQRLLLERINASEQTRVSAREFNTPDSNWTRRFLVIMFMTMAFTVLLAPLFGLPTVVQFETPGWNIFGFTFGKEVIFQTIEGMIAPSWLGQAIMSVVGFYFGQSVASRKHL